MFHLPKNSGSDWTAKEFPPPSKQCALLERQSASLRIRVDLHPRVAQDVREGAKVAYLYHIGLWNQR